jgi:hypothetical protein
VAPPPPEPPEQPPAGDVVPPELPCAGLVGGVLPVPPTFPSGELGFSPEPPPPDPPGLPALLKKPPPPPPVDVIVENTESDPELPLVVGGADPPAPIVIV